MYLMIDNYDSFVYNLKAYLEELGRDIMVRRSDEITIEEIEAMASFSPRGRSALGTRRCAWRR